ncbi:ArgE/DapE family deacylase [Mangrovitalea sediminis]|uniref:ArgE/DapE family deacylase n=1 Tax=Mangrovitalea sediminis TaxID=1982043 RepID=UPI000BE5A298|nr:ArgE/DapE family deacylase [Mangrovitalea sediminis]
MLSADEKRLLQSCDAVFDTTLELTEDLVRGYSVLGNEQDALKTMEQWLRALDLPVERVPLDAPGLADNPHHAPVDWSNEGRYSLVSRLNPDAAGKHLVFNGHLDVVPADPVDAWTRPPWEPWRKDGWLYGRGSGDMKAGIAAMVMAVEAVRESGQDIDFPLTLQTVIEEECTGNGALACLHQGYTGDFVLIPEPFGAQIYSGQVGALWFRIKVRGVPTHVLDPRAGSSAIARLQQYIPALEALEEELNAARQAPYDCFEHPFNLNIGKISGGNWASSVAAYAELEGRLAFPPGMTPAEIMDRVRTVIDARHAVIADESTPSPIIEFHGFRSEGHLVDLQAPGIKLLSECHEALTGELPREYLSTCTTDLRAFHVEGGIAGTCYGPIAKHIHGVDECVDIESIRQTLQTYALFISRWGKGNRS